ncbi:MAG: ABC transporter ATP-binding protein [Myxococcales bacterium]|nr:ABC transporter ATP-binding protein [Myxococcales bacterium]
MTRHAVEARQITKVFGTGPLAYQALRGVDLAVEAGEFLMLAGPSGSGKTTLLSIVGCVLGATSGTLHLAGQDVTKLTPSALPDLRLHRIGFIFQGHNLIASLSARENVALVAKMQGRGSKEAQKRADALLERVGLSDKRTNLPSELSGGQRQRVAIARALVADPPLVLADEPTAALDAQSGQIVTELLRELCRQRGHTVIVVTHDSRIFHLADRMVHIEDGQITSDREEASS